jgi:hypothetical protein
LQWHKKHLHVYPLLIIVLILLLGGIGCNPPYNLSSGEPVVLAEGGTQNPDFQTLITQLEKFTPTVRPLITKDSSNIDGMVLLHNKLEEIGIKTALVVVNTQEGKPFETFIGVETSDKGLCYFDLVPQSLNVDSTEVIQSVFLEEGKKIGLIAAKFNSQNTYSWYEDYLAKVYQQYDWAKYLFAYKDIVQDNIQRLDSIEKTDQEIRKELEDSSNWAFVTQAQLDSFTTEFNSRIERYNGYTIECNSQIQDFNNELAQYEKQDENFPSNIYYITEVYSNIRPILVLPPAIQPEIVPITPSIPCFEASCINNLFSQDDYYIQKPRPDRESIIKVDRVTDWNFVVNSIELWW